MNHKIVDSIIGLEKAIRAELDQERERKRLLAEAKEQALAKVMAYLHSMGLETEVEADAIKVSYKTILLGYLNYVEGRVYLGGFKVPRFFWKRALVKFITAILRPLLLEVAKVEKVYGIGLDVFNDPALGLVRSNDFGCCGCYFDDPLNSDGCKCPTKTIRKCSAQWKRTVFDKK